MDNIYAQALLILIKILLNHFYLLFVKLDICGGSHNILHALSEIFCIQRKLEEVNLKFFGIIKSKTELEWSVRHSSCDCRCYFYGPKT